MGNTGTVRAFFQLKSQERAIALKTALALFVTWTSLRIFGFSSWKNWTTHLSAKNNSVPPMSVEGARQLANLSTATARRLFIRTNCLEQSLVIWFLLRRRGVSATLRFGGRKDGDQFEAHAWVEWQGVVLNDEGAVREKFTPFEPLEEPLATLEKYTR
jgi:hypothetical protein